MSDVGRIVQISVSPGGVPKLAVEAARVTVDGVEGDAHRNRQRHGGPDRAVCLYSMDAIRALFLLEVTRYTTPCLNIKAAFVHGEYARVAQHRHPGWSRVYTRVLREGIARAGDAATLLPA